MGRFTVSPAALALAVLGLGLALADTRAAEGTKYPDWNGGWARNTPGAQWDPSKPGGIKQEPPLTSKYQSAFEDNLKAIRDGDEGYNPHARCMPAGMPRTMLAYEPLEIIVTPQTTYIRDYFNDVRRIFTDGREWPATLERSFDGYSIGQWVDDDGDGTYDTLMVETRGFRGPRVFDATGIPLAEDNSTVIKERIFLDKANHDLLRDEITTVDDALTRPWTVMRTYDRERDPLWPEYICAEDNHHVVLRGESYFMNADGNLMPTRKNQPPPDLRYFDQSQR
jgi:hypothetical protein